MEKRCQLGFQGSERKVFGAYFLHRRATRLEVVNRTVNFFNVVRAQMPEPVIPPGHRVASPGGGVRDDTGGQRC